jgi:hypothetical protein
MSFEERGPVKELEDPVPGAVGPDAQQAVEQPAESRRTRGDDRARQLPQERA